MSKTSSQPRQETSPGLTCLMHDMLICMLKGTGTDRPTLPPAQNLALQHEETADKINFLSSTG